MIQELWVEDMVGVGRAGEGNDTGDEARYSCLAGHELKTWRGPGGGKAERL